VISLAEIKRVLKQKKTGGDGTKIINYINNRLSHTSNERRKNIKLSEFLNKNPNLSLDFVSKVADSVLKEKVNKVADKLIFHNEAGININEADLLSDDVKKMLSESLSLKKERFINKKDFQPYFKNKDSEAAISDNIKRIIESAITMSDDLEFFRTKFENDLLKIFTFEPKNKERIENLLNEWIDLRINDLKTKPEYKFLNDSQFKHVMLDGFKEKVVTELGLRDHIDNFREFEIFFPIDKSEDHYKSDIANKHNLNHIMENALGYDRLSERLQSPKHSAKLAQGNYFERLLAEYFVDKRKDYKASKDMLEVLNREFNRENFYDQTKRIGQDLNEITAKASANQMNSDGLSTFDALSNANKGEYELYHEDKEKLMKLGDDTNYAIQGETHGVAEELLKYSNKDNKWVDLYPKFDIRRTPKQWVEDRLYDIVKNYFSAREKIETSMPTGDNPSSKSCINAVDRAMTRNELKSFDKQLALKLNKDKMIMKLLQELDYEYAELMQIRTSSKFEDQNNLDSMVQAKKTP
jgi:hypothetical protein